MLSSKVSAGLEWLTFLREFQERGEEKQRQVEEREEKKEREALEREEREREEREGTVIGRTESGESEWIVKPRRNGEKEKRGTERVKPGRKG